MLEPENAAAEGVHDGHYQVNRSSVFLTYFTHTLLTSFRNCQSNLSHLLILNFTNWSAIIKSVLAAHFRGAYLFRHHEVPQSRSLDAASRPSRSREENLVVNVDKCRNDKDGSLIGCCLQHNPTEKLTIAISEFVRQGLLESLRSQLIVQPFGFGHGLILPHLFFSPLPTLFPLESPQLPSSELGQIHAGMRGKAQGAQELKVN